MVAGGYYAVAKVPGLLLGCCYAVATVLKVVARVLLCSC